jgi:hypothetical protein
MSRKGNGHKGGVLGLTLIHTIRFTLTFTKNRSHPHGVTPIFPRHLSGCPVIIVIVSTKGEVVRFFSA